MKKHHELDENTKRRQGRDWTAFKSMFAEKLWPELEETVVDYLSRTRWWYISAIEEEKLNFKEIAIMWVLSSSRETSVMVPDDNEIWAYKDLFRARIILNPDLAGEYFKYVYENMGELAKKHWPEGHQGVTTRDRDTQTEQALIRSLIPPHQERGLFEGVFALAAHKAFESLEASGSRKNKERRQ